MTNSKCSHIEPNFVFVFFLGASKRTLEIPEPSHSACCWKFLTADGATERELLFYVTHNPHLICKKKK